jgi:glycerophosphoryl diester phosphodiesterase
MFHHNNDFYHSKIIAHRGIGLENSLRSIRAAWNSNLDVEVDVRVTKDRQIVLIHDSTTTRMCGIKRRVRHETLKHLQKLKLRQTKQNIPTLQQALRRLPTNRRLFIDVKCGEEIVHPLVRVFQKTPKLNQVAIISFKLSTLQAIRKHLKNATLYLGTRQPDLTISEIDGYLCYKLNPDLIEQIHEHKKKVVAWGLRSVGKVEKLIKLGVDGLIVDQPETLTQLLTMRKITFL